jgi:hypothetical protein
MIPKLRGTLSSFCLEGDKIIATDGGRLIVAKDVDIESLTFCGEERMVADRFLLRSFFFVFCQKI